MPYNPQIHHRHSIRLRGYDYTSAGIYFVTLCTQDRACVLGEIVHNAIVLSDEGRIVAQSWMWLGDHHPYIDLDVWMIMPNHLHGIIIISNDIEDNSRTDDSRMTHPSTGGSRTAHTRITNPRMDGSRTDDPCADGPHIPHPGTGGSRTAPLPIGDSWEGDSRIAPTETTNPHTHNPCADDSRIPHPGTGDSHIPYPGTGGSRTALSPSPAAKCKPLGRLIGAFKTISTKQINEIHNTPGDRFWLRNYWEHIIRDESSLARIQNYIINNPARWTEDRLHPTQPPLSQ